jgi:transcriptional regulator with XRE-family HTH domain
MAKIGRRQHSETEVEYNARIGAMIAKVRKERDMQQKELAELLGISDSMMYFYEVGAHGMTPFMVMLASEALGVSVAVLMQTASFPMALQKRCAECLKNA